MVTMNDKYYPYINEFVSFRLSEKKVQLRNLKKRVDTIVDLHGSAFPSSENLLARVLSVRYSQSFISPLMISILAQFERIIPKS